MPSKSLTLKFGADTSKLDRALKRLRKGMASSLRGAGRRGIGLGGAAVGGALGGFAGGAFAGGATGMASRLFGDLMDASPQFAQAMLSLGEDIRTKLQPHMEDLATALVQATPKIAQFVNDMIKGSTRILELIFGEHRTADPGYFTPAGAVQGGKAIGDIAGGSLTGTGSGTTIYEALGGIAGVIGELAGMTPGGKLVGINRERAVGSVVQLQSMFQSDYEGIAPGTI